jgi:hypothetical protein
MPIYRMLQGAALDDEAVKAMTTAFEDALGELSLTDRTDPLTEIIAKRIIECGQHGERDPSRLREVGLTNLDAQDVALGVGRIWNFPTVALRRCLSGRAFRQACGGNVIGGNCSSRALPQSGSPMPSVRLSLHIGDSGVLSAIGPARYPLAAKTKIVVSRVTNRPAALSRPQI